ncbi:MAG: ThiF family adenylyltransferase [Gammaproteobacteria bacterium]|nr:ThiF family adenylyltransferase [Gammaproteobacteria bacterium]
MTEVLRPLASETVAIVGVGGTGSHVLDFVCKAKVKEIHIFDDDDYDEETPRRSPGPPATGDARYKVTRHADRYAALHDLIVPHPERIGEDNAERLTPFDTVFLCSGGSGRFKSKILDVCMRSGALLIDVGMAAYVSGRETINAMVRVTTLTRENHDHAGRIGLHESGTDPATRNLQTVELNALNAALAVIQWKQFRGVYRDIKHEMHCVYDVQANCLSNRYTSRSRN